MNDDPLIPRSPSAQAYAVDADQGDVFTSDDPFRLFAAWLTHAKPTEPNDANAMSLATVDANGAPDVRIVLLKDVNDEGFSFYSNQDSAKGRQLSVSNRAALCFHWKTIRRQVRIRGEISEVSSEQADAYFATRARGAQIGAHASAQSAVMEAPSAPDAPTPLEQAIDTFEKKYPGDVPRPAHWTGWRVLPLEIEFWVNRPYRLHDRLIFRRDGPDKDWSMARLFP